MDLTRSKDFQLHENEEILLKSIPSKKALIIIWIAGPAFLLVNAILNFVGALLLAGLFAFLKVIFIVPIILVVIAWLGVCLLMTYRHFQYELVVTDHRVIGRAGQEEMDILLSEVVNVHLERSTLGRILGYGAIVVQTKRKSITFKNLEDPKRVYNLLMPYAEKYCAY